MKRPTFSPIFAIVTTLLWFGGGAAFAQEEEPEMTFEEDDASAEVDAEADAEVDADADADADLGAGDGEMTFELGADGEVVVDDKDLEASGGGEGTAAALPSGNERRVSWQDIVVVVRKPFLKVNRLEILPTWGVTMNDNIIRHLQFTGQLNYYLTDVLAVGLEGAYYIKDLREPFDLVRRQAQRLPTLNKYNYGASLNFHYVPVYGKFAIFDKHLVHWETFFTAGVGFTQSEVLPRDPRFNSFTNFLITPNVGASMRFFVSKFLTVNVGLRDYVFVDKFEATNRTEISGEVAKESADSSIINNVVFQAGISFWFPTSFEYTTFR